MFGDACSEHNILFKFMSGLHASVNTHISEGFWDEKDEKLTHNTTYFLNSVGDHEDRIKNLHLTYAAVTQAIKLMEPFLLTHTYSTGLD